MLHMKSNDCTLAHYVPLRNFAVWPGNNRYFYKGILECFKSINTRTKQSKFIFIDFQMCNLLLLLDQDWLMFCIFNRIVLITDRHLLPLANYYKDTLSKVDSVILGTGTPEESFKKINHVISGEKVMPPSKIRFSSREICLLRMLTRGFTVQVLADRLQLNPKTVYALRHNILEKMGLAKINDIFIRASPK
ncbi:LuxR C-terminal-related transcriptional regulator [Serratia sp. UGAL515B_01]|uniref:LuxR C-terminal-related transcriptional regulator n=1 Tax=Serratia sp. UGAL515B_01 TaxID=2986763 RepID=UPI0029539BD3|nr:LuxR C-terminal-related transcriptional regulator [Serratia sp. UGAL515B_01]WON76154.1 LuxR C-terminal-related transcriptional regulator [Serratia sp. UGAL515B_01]